MKKSIYPLLSLLCLLICGISQRVLAQKTPKITLEQIAEKCKNQPLDKRMTVKVVRFSVTNSRAQEQGEFGGELATMLTNALQKTSCFRVLETDGNMGDITGDGLDAQLVVTGEVTEFSEKNSNLIGIQKSRVNIGFILKVLNPQTSDILFSESVNGESISSGFSSSVFSSTKLSGSVANACEQAIIKAAEILADQKDKIQAPVLQPVKKFNAGNCALLRTGKGPKIMILIPETQTTGGLVIDRRLTRKEQEAKERQENRLVLMSAISLLKKNSAAVQPASDNNSKKTVVVEQTTAEGELINKFIEAGFRVVDPSVYNKLRDQSTGQADDKAKMAALGLKLGADIIITGTANSEQTASKQEGNFSFRGRVELRALATEDATILASHSEISSAEDRAESISAQKSLRSASAKMATYLLEQLCSRNMTFASSGPARPTATASAPTSGANITDIAVTNASFTKLQTLAGLLTKNPKVKSVQKSLKGTTGTLHIEHSGSTDDLLEALGKSPATKFDVTDMEEGKISLTLN